MWKTVEGQLYRKFSFDDFSDAINFINQVAELAEQANHHPTIKNTYNCVELWLSTHDTDSQITIKDKDMAHKINELLENPNPREATHKKVKLYSDGGSRGNPGPSASGYVLLDINGKVIKKAGVYLGITTNNQAEYQSLVFGLKEAQNLGAEEVEAYMDSLLVVNQINGKFKIKNQELKPHYESIKDLAKQFKQISFSHVPRELNKLADAEVNTTLDAEALKQ